MTNSRQTKMWLAALTSALVMVAAMGVWAQTPSAATPEVASAAPVAPPRYDPKVEAEVGRKAAEDLEKELKIADDPKQVERITKITQALAPHTSRPEVTYKCKVVATPDINAFALPGGYIYVTQGVLAAVESDDELAGVLAHEMAHNCLWHGMDLLRRERKIAPIFGGVLLAAILAGSSNADPAQVAVMGQYVKMGVVNGWTREDEAQADSAAIDYLRASPYNPVGLLTVVEGLARMDARRPQLEMGVAQTHPLSAERAEAVIAKLTRLGVPINRRLVTHSLVANAEKVTVDGVEINRVTMGKTTVFEPRAAAGDVGVSDRAQAIADALNELVNTQLQMMEVRVSEVDGRPAIFGRDRCILSVYPEDAVGPDQTPQKVADAAAAAIKRALWADIVSTSY